MSRLERLGSLDMTWLQIERNTNLMQVIGVLVLASPLERAVLADCLRTRLLLCNMSQDMVHGFPAQVGAVTPEETERLKACAERTRWPGNVRHLKNVLGRYLTFREQPRSVEANWEFSLKMDDTAYNDGPDAHVLPAASSQIAEDAAAPSETPDGAMAVRDHIDNLIFLTIAREVFASTGRGALAVLGRRTDMTGAGAASRLKKLKIATEPMLDIAQLEAHIDELRASLQPFTPYLRSLLSL